MSGLKDNRRWELLPRDVRVERLLQKSCNVSPLVARVMAARGIKTAEQAQRFLTPSLERDWHDPLDIPGMSQAADRVDQALRDGERIAIFGDFDVDGMSSTCLLTLALRHFGGVVAPYIPNRFGEGYGLSREALTRVIEGSHPSLIVTVDNGIASAHEVAWLLRQGIDVVVTDHHEPGDLVPQGVPVTDPKLEADCPSRDLAGAGVALKLVCELGRRRGEPDYWRHYTELATLGTVSDMMVLQDENRALVADGIRQMRHTARPGLVALAATAGIDLSTVTSDSLPFSLIPRLNAAGRMGSTDLAFDLLLTSDPADAAVLAGKLEQINNERREIESELTEQAMAKLDASYKGGRVIVVGGEGWHEGVKGIVASRIVNKYHVPTILFSISDGVARGSGRSVGTVDLFHAVEQCSDLLVRFGGHAGAVGVTCDVENLDAFRQRLEEVMDQLPAEQFEDRGEVAALVSLSEVTMANIASLEAMQPFGQGNKKPLFGVRGVLMRNRSRVGYSGNHLRFLATNGVCSVPAIMFRTPDIERASDYEGAVDLVFDAVNETWQGRTKPKLMVKDILFRDAKDVSCDASLSARLFAHTDEILSRDEYAGIADATSFFTRVVGMPDAKATGTLSAGQTLRMRHQADTGVGPDQECLVALLAPDGTRVGYLRRQIANVLAPLMDAGTEYVATVVGSCPSEGSSYLGVEVCRRPAQQAGQPATEGAAVGVGSPAQPDADLRRKEELASLGYDQLTDGLRSRMIGDHDFLPAQRQALELLRDGHNTLCVMATGRGKSLIFHVHAAREAIMHGKASVFVYPLRALVADQLYHLQEALGPLGLHVRTLTGETPLEERDDTFGALAEGRADVILTTPEFLAIHCARFARGGRVGFVVVDEAHHAGSSRGGGRDAYEQLPKVLHRLGDPTVLAVSATAPTPVARHICQLCSIKPDDVVVDRSVRQNLTLRDLRELREREAALVSVVASGQKSVVYVNSREQSVSLARMLRRDIPDLGHRIAFYNAGLTRADRASVESAFRDGTLTCIISTSAFGEGVNLPDIRNVLLYHMPLGSIEFNQMSGRAGRDGKPASVYLLFGSRDARVNERILSGAAPSRDELATLYRTLMTIARSRATRQTPDGLAEFRLANADIAQAALDLNPCTRVDERTVSCGISIFRELGLLRVQGFGSARTISMTPSPAHVDLDSSIRFLEGARLREEFSSFCDWALSSRPQEMLSRINRPITPSFGRIVEN